MKKFAVIIVNYNCFTHTKDLLESLTQFDSIIDVFCVDNNSTADDRIEIKCYRKENVRYLLLKENLGFAEGNNQAIKEALKVGYQYIVLLNPDTLIEDSNFFVVLEKELVDTGADIVGPLIKYYPAKEKIYFAGGYVSKYTGLTKMRGKGETDRGQYSNGYECDFITGAAMLIKKEVFNEMGLLPEEYFLYFEETDFCIKAKRLNLKVYFTPKTCVYHKVSKSIGYVSDTYLYYMIRNYRMFSLKYVEWYYLPLFWIFYCFVWVPGYMFLSLKSGNIKGFRSVVRGLIG